MLYRCGYMRWFQPICRDIRYEFRDKCANHCRCTFQTHSHNTPKWGRTPTFKAWYYCMINTFCFWTLVAQDLCLLSLGILLSGWLGSSGPTDRALKIRFRESHPCCISWIYVMSVFLFRVPRMWVIQAVLMICLSQQLHLTALNCGTWDLTG